MPIERGSAQDPVLNSLPLCCREFPASVGRGHLFVRIAALDAADEFALLGLPGDDRDLARFGRTDRRLALVQTQSGFSCLGIGAVTLIAGIRQQGLDISLIRDFRRSAGRGEAGICRQVCRGRLFHIRFSLVICLPNGPLVADQLDRRKVRNDGRAGLGCELNP